MNRQEIRDRIKELKEDKRRTEKELRSFNTGEGGVSEKMLFAASFMAPGLRTGHRLGIQHNLRDIENEIQELEEMLR